MDSNQEDLSIDFAQLAESDEVFAHVFKSSNGHLDFQDPRTVQQLTKSILKARFGLQIELPDDRLCPPVPIRYEYIRWMQGLIDTTGENFQDGYDTAKEVLGIDIGIGASCIYALLGCAGRPTWKFIGTEIDDKNLQFATSNVELNNLQSRIHLVKTTPSRPLMDVDTLNVENADFVMCNPPFFTSKEDMIATHTTKKRSPSAVCTGADFEMITDGGDLGFVLRILSESLTLQNRIQWYSSMLGKLSSVYAVVSKLKECGVTNWAVTTLQAGNVTRRWAVAWSFTDRRPANNIARHSFSAKEILPFPTEHVIPIHNLDYEEIVSKINQTMKQLDLAWSYVVNDSCFHGTCFAYENVWSRAARRKQKQQIFEHADQPEIAHSNSITRSTMENAALGVRIQVRASTDMSLVDKVVVRWLKGNNSVLLESFLGMLRRTVAS